MNQEIKDTYGDALGVSTKARIRRVYVEALDENFSFSVDQAKQLRKALKDAIKEVERLEDF